jgi:hypothetical protein
LESASSLATAFGTMVVAAGCLRISVAMVLIE